LRGEQVEPEATQPQPVEQPTQQVGDDEVAKALQNPKVLQAVQEHVAQATQQANAAANYYAAAVQQNAELTLAGFQSRNPELRNIPMQNWAAVLQSINQSNPQRASQILAEFDNAKTVLAEHQRIRAAQEQAYQQQQSQAWTQFAKAADDAF